MPLVFFLRGQSVLPLMLVLKHIAGVEERSRCCTRSLGGWRRATAARSSHSSRRKPHCSSYTVSKRKNTFVWTLSRLRFKNLPLKISWLAHLCLQERLIVFTQRAEWRLSDVQESLILEEINSLLVFWLKQKHDITMLQLSFYVTSSSSWCDRDLKEGGKQKKSEMKKSRTAGYFL